MPMKHDIIAKLKVYEIFTHQFLIHYRLFVR